MVIQEWKIGDSVGTGRTGHQNLGARDGVRAAGVLQGGGKGGLYRGQSMDNVSRCPS